MLTKRNVQIIIAATCLLLSIFVTVLSCLGIGGSYKTCDTTITRRARDCSFTNIDFHIDDWDEDGPWTAKYAGNARMRARYFIFVCEFCLICAALALLVLRFIRKPYPVTANQAKRPTGTSLDVIIAAAALFTALLAGCLEAWYASGTAITGFFCHSWAAAAGFLFLIAIFWAVDLWYTYKKRYN